MSGRGPQNVQNEDSNAVSSFIRDIPPVTRVLLFGTFFATFLSLTKMIPIMPFVIDWQMIIYKFQIWRPFLTIFHAGQLGFGFLIHLYFIYSYSRQLEQNIFFGRAANYCWMLAICLAVILALAVPFGYPFAGPGLMMAIIHVWGRHAENVKISLYGIFQIPAKYLSIAIVVINSALSGGVNMGDVAGVLAGHTYYWLDSIFPHMPQGRNVIVVPGWFERLIGVIEDTGSQAVARMSGEPATPSGSSATAPRGSATGSRSAGVTRPTVRHTWGSGRTLGSS